MSGVMRASRAEIDLTALAGNVASFRRHVRRETEIMAVVKAGGYGHGAGQVATAALGAGATRLGVAYVEEGVQLRQAGLKVPILVMGTPFADQAELFFNHGLTPTVYNEEQALVFSREACRRGTPLNVHVKVDTGMGRIGVFPPREAVELIARLAEVPGLGIEGLFTHFATADEADLSFARQQLTLFQELLSALDKRDLRPPLVHAANSAAAIVLPESWFDLVRVGISLYGCYPSGEMDRKGIILEPVMSLKSRVAHVKNVPAGTTISYGKTHITPQATRVATIPLGYADGYNRLFSNRGEVLIRGKRHPVIGRVCMDQFMVDTGKDPAITRGDEVVIMGRQGGEEISADEIATALQTISYEVLCAVSKRVPRHYLP